MISNHLLKEKEHVQKKLYDETNHNLKKYAEKTHQIVKDVELKYGISFKYVTKDTNHSDRDEISLTKNSS